MKIQRFILIFFIILSTSAPAGAATVSWNNVGDGLWSESAKWSPVKVPDAADDVFINNSGAGTITVGTEAAAKTLKVGGDKSITLATGKLTLSLPLAKSWGTPVLIETNNVGEAINPDVAIDASGNIVAVWDQDDGTMTFNYSIWSNRYTASTGLWGTEDLIETTGTEDESSSNLAMDGSGNSVVMWCQYDGTLNKIWANRYTYGSGWGTAALIVTDKGDTNEPPYVAINTSGNAVAVWEQSDGTRTNIWASRYTSATGLWSTAVMIETNNAGSAYDPDVVIDASGNAVAVWHQHDGTRTNIWSNRYTYGSGWGTAALIETDNAGDAEYPSLAINASGNAVAVWQQSDGTRYNIWSNRYTATTGLWGTAELIETDDGDAEYTDAQVAIDASGNVIAVWYQHDGTRNNIWSNRYTSGSNWGTAGLIESSNEDAEYPYIAMDGSSNAVVVWHQYDGTRYNIWSNRYTYGSGWGTAELIESSNEDAEYPYVAINASGNAVAVWEQYDGTRTNIWANLYR